ncbi:serine hydrolase [Bryobacter aggregatus]|uniref:serine hydrolase n=1 Tax=Bryobacter aggregatus TaxID=360054 RepID=UPI0004E1B8E1|nr:serine hydrolase [Bryobacter aggregatus]
MEHLGIRQTILILVFAVASFAQESKAKFDELVSAYAKQGFFSGSVLVAKGGKPVFEKAYGMANYEWNLPNAVDTKLRLGSITKQFAATAILQLEEAGKLKVSDKACAYLPACPEAWKPVTLHQLLTHTSGIPNFTSFPEYRNIQAKPSRYDEQVKVVWEKPLDFDPGTKYQYSNTGYLILGKIIEKASGKNWEDYVRESIFLPAGMSDTRADSNTDLIARRANGYLSNSGTTLNAGYINMAIPGAAGALLSTAHDLYLWDRALAAGKLLKPETAARMWTVEKNGYAYGWTVNTAEGRTTQGHNGGIDGFSTSIERVPADGVLVVVLSNFQDGQVGLLKTALMKMAYGETVEIPKQHVETRLDSALLDEYIGTYEMSPEFRLVVTREGDQLMTQATGQGKLPIYAEQKDVFFPKRMPATLTFVRENGKVTGLILHQNGRDMKAKRL